MRRLLLLALLLALLGGCKKPAVKVTTNTQPQPQQPTPAPTKDQPSVHAPTGTVINPNLGGGGGGGASQAVRKAVKRAATQNDLKQLHTFIDNFSLSNGQMPTREQVAAALQKEAPNLYKLWQEQVIEVTGTRTRENIWAYSVEPQSVGGDHLFVTSSGVDRLNGQSLKQRLSQEAGQ
jgi:type II secretory pathway pseudopilin PulG